MARRPAPVKPAGTPLPHNWMQDFPGWKVAAMLARIPPDEYLSEARRFEADALANGTLSEDWSGAWRDHCRRRLVERFAGKAVEEPASLGLFDI